MATRRGRASGTGLRASTRSRTPSARATRGTAAGSSRARDSARGRATGACGGDRKKGDFSIAHN